MQLHTESLPGVRLVVDGIESVGWIFSAANEIRNVMRQTKSSQRNGRPASANRLRGRQEARHTDHNFEHRLMTPGGEA